MLNDDQRMLSNQESQPVAWLLQRSYKPPKGSVRTDGIVTLALRFYRAARLAARTITSRAHADIF